MAKRCFIAVMGVIILAACASEQGSEAASTSTPIAQSAVAYASPPQPPTFPSAPPDVGCEAAAGYVSTPVGSLPAMKCRDRSKSVCGPTKQPPEGWCCYRDDNGVSIIALIDGRKPREAFDCQGDGFSRSDEVDWPEQF